MLVSHLIAIFRRGMVSIIGEIHIGLIQSGCRSIHLQFSSNLKWGVYNISTVLNGHWLSMFDFMQGNQQEELPVGRILGHGLLIGGPGFMNSETLYQADDQKIQPLLDSPAFRQQKKPTMVL